MQIRNIIDSDLLLEMAYTQKKAERIITSLEKPMNDHLLKLWTSSGSSCRERLVHDLVDWIDEISEIVLRPKNVRPPHIFYYKLLFFEPFGGGAEIPNVLRRLRRLHRQGFVVQTDVLPDALLNRLRMFHRDFSSTCASRIMLESQIREFIADH